MLPFCEQFQQSYEVMISQNTPREQYLQFITEANDPFSRELIATYMAPFFISDVY